MGADQAAWGAIGAGALLLGGTALHAGVLVRVARSWARRVGFVDRPNVRKFHREPTPYGGGLAIWAAVWSVVGAGLVCAGWVERDAPPWIPPELARHAAGVVSRVGQLGVIFAGSVVLLVVGYVDDRRGMGPLAKLVAQLVVALGVALGGVRVTGFLPWPALHVLVTVAWIVVVTNALNLLDNMDGLSSGVAAIATLALTLAALASGQWFVAAFGLVLAGALLGFLWHNFPPATIFMGDTGSLNVGYLLAVLTIQGTYYAPSAGAGALGGAHAVLLPLVVLAIPLFDTTSVILLRLRLGKPIYIGDTNHVSHRLVRMGMSPRRAVLSIYLMSLCTGIGAVLLPRVDGQGACLVGLQVLLMLLLVAQLEGEARRHREAEEASDPRSEAPR